jgi:hypothetical protein
LAKILNHLELFSIIFGASLVFKIYSNFAFKIIPKNGFLFEKWTLKLAFKNILEKWEESL